ncbi:hypothetical protein SARC_01847 [Sphaeroforma arctica JP610]|uniref:Uncharacterized protein n=1 Tax=Sphaeroforma arctica JP610 TaxID=667725 RepID=A0A0L0GAE4_9EUKA|nr:hypothetical protein SARC_01847 [Sphaeroforma arctica JP610]KNC86002.1 hypothetical protein SARC_01847 [Sphaeroforma arctica JP610]|eukprot:XP_014159904.1 hypothetical protein SARC_01847 [Sphaeroforma arctica JP610]
MKKETQAKLRRYGSGPLAKQNHVSAIPMPTYLNHSTSNCLSRPADQNSMHEFANALSSPTMTSNTNIISPIALHDVDYTQQASASPDSSIYRRKSNLKTGMVANSDPPSPLCHYKHTFDPTVTTQRIVVGIYSSQASETSDIEPETTNPSVSECTDESSKVIFSHGKVAARRQSSLSARARTIFKSVLARTSTTGSR